MRQDFARYLQRNYASWLHEGDSDRPPLSVDIGAEFLRPGARHARAGDAGGGGLPPAGSVGHDPAADQRPVRHRDGALLLHPAHRHAVRAERHLQRPLSGRDQGALPRVVARQRGCEPQRPRGRAADRALRELTGRQVPVHYEKVFTAADGEGLLKRLPGAPGAGRRHRAGLQLHRPAHPRPHRELDPLRGGPRHAGAAEPHPHLVRALAALGRAARGGAPAACRCC